MQEFNIEKLQLLETEKAKIRKEYERRESTIEMKRKMCVVLKPPGDRACPSSIHHPSGRSQYALQEIVGVAFLLFPFFLCVEHCPDGLACA